MTSNQFCTVSQCSGLSQSSVLIPHQVYCETLGEKFQKLRSHNLIQISTTKVICNQSCQRKDLKVRLIFVNALYCIEAMVLSVYDVICNREKYFNFNSQTMMYCQVSRAMILVMSSSTLMVMVWDATVSTSINTRARVVGTTTGLESSERKITSDGTD